MANNITKVSWDEINSITKTLADDISKKHHIDCIVAIARGGLVPARYLAKYLNIKRIYTFGIEFYNDVNKKFRVPHIYQKFTTTFNANQVVLIVDDVIDSGESMGVVVNKVIKNGAKNFVTCSLHYKPKSTYKPSFYGKQIENTVWIKYDWEK